MTSRRCRFVGELDIKKAESYFYAECLCFNLWRERGALYTLRPTAYRTYQEKPITGTLAEQHLNNRLCISIAMNSRIVFLKVNFECTKNELGMIVNFLDYIS